MKQKVLVWLLSVCMVFTMMPLTSFADGVPKTISGQITEDVIWNDGDVVEGVTIAGDVTITVKGTVTVKGTIKLTPESISNVIFTGENNAKLIRGSEFNGQMFYAEGVSSNFQNLTFKDITLDGGAVWTGDVDKTLNRGTTNSGVKATGSVLYLLYTNAVLNNSDLQNHDDSTGEKANAVFLRYYSTIEFNKSVVKDNNSPSSYYSGGVITVRQGGTATTIDSEVYGNSGVQGGFFGISSTGSYGGIAIAKDSEFHNNYADAGAIFDMQCNSKKGYLQVEGCEFYDNASDRGLFYEHAYSRPFIIKDSTFHDNECAVWDCHTDPVLDISGKIVVKEDTDYTNYLFETPLVLSGSLAEGSSIAMSEASMTKLMNNSGYLVTGTQTYEITDEDLAKFALADGYKFVYADMNSDGIKDAIAIKDDVKMSIELTLIDGFNGDIDTQKAPANTKFLPVCNFDHDGYKFAGWYEGDDKVAAKIFTGATKLTAKWALIAPTVKLSSDDATLKATVTNASDAVTYTYQWYKGDNAIEGATKDTYTMTDVNSATYKCEVTASMEGFASATGSASCTSSAPAIAQVGDDKYGSLQAAIDAANNGDIVKVLSDITIDAGNVNTVTTDDEKPVLFKIEGKFITLDMNGKTITADFDNADKMYFAAFYVADGSDLTVEGNGTFNAKSVKKIDDPELGERQNLCYVFWKRGTTGTLTIQDGNYKANNLEDSMIYTNGDEIVTVKGGTFTLDKIGTVPNGNGSPWIFNAKGRNENHIIVTGGTFNADVNHQYWVFEVQAPKDKALKDNGDGTWTVVPAEAYVDEWYYDKYCKEVGYATLEEAVKAANTHGIDKTTNKAKITLLKDCKISNTLHFEKAAELDLESNDNKIIWEGKEGKDNTPIVSLDAGVTLNYFEPSREGYEFKSWYTDANYENAWNRNRDFESLNSQTRATANVTSFYAKWEALPTEPVVPEDPTTPEEPAEDPAEDPADEVDTGDDMNVAIPMGIAALAMMAAAATVLVRRRSQR